MTLGIDAVAYWQCVSVTRPNGLGQHLDHTFKDLQGRPGVQSHFALMRYQKTHGKERFDHALDILFRKG